MTVNPPISKELQIFIVGSCVSRDAFELVDAPELVEYVARTSIASAFAPAISFANSISLDLNPSPFQRRMVEIDLKKILASQIRDARFDFLLLDLIDERLPLIKIDQSYITLSPELEACGFVTDPKSLLEQGSPEYYEAFEVGVRKLVDLVGTERIIVNKVFWATETTNGDALGGVSWIDKNNKILSKLYKILESYNLNFLEYSDSQFKSDPAHKWGPAPYHFGGRLLQDTIDKIRIMGLNHA